MPTKIPAGPAIEVKAAALREDTIRSVSVWSPRKKIFSIDLIGRSGAIPAAVGILNVAVRFFRVKIRTLGMSKNAV